MTQENKELLLRDLCARIPYGVKVNNEIQGDFTLIGLTKERVFTTCEIEGCHNDFPIELIKPYLFPLSSMTEWQDRELEILMKNSIESCRMLSPYDCLEMERFFNENHLDWRGLIPMNLAIDVTGLNIY